MIILLLIKLDWVIGIIGGYYYITGYKMLYNFWLIYI